MNAREGSDDSTMYNSTSFHYVEFLIDYRSPTVRRFSNFPSQATENWYSPSLRSGESLNYDDDNNIYKK